MRRDNASLLVQGLVAVALNRGVPLTVHNGACPHWARWSQAGPAGPGAWSHWSEGGPGEDHKRSPQ